MKRGDSEGRRAFLAACVSGAATFAFGGSALARERRVRELRVRARSNPSLPPLRAAPPNWALELEREGDRAPGIVGSDPFPDGAAVFTFDDGPSPTKTPRILDVLRIHGVRAAFFECGKEIHADSYHLIRRIITEGHIVANHSYRHDNKMPRLDKRHGPEFTRQELQLNQAMVDIALLSRSRGQFERLRRRVLPVDEPSAEWVRDNWHDITARWRELLAERIGEGHPYRMIYVRPPGGEPFLGHRPREERQAYLEVLAELGLLNVMWSYSSGDSDWRLPKKERHRPERLVRNIMRGMKRGGVLLMHDRIPSRALDKALWQITARRPLRVMSLHEAIAHKYGCTPNDLLRQLAAERGGEPVRG